MNFQPISHLQLQEAPGNYIHQLMQFNSPTRHEWPTKKMEGQLIGEVEIPETKKLDSCIRFGVYLGCTCWQQMVFGNLIFKKQPTYCCKNGWPLASDWVHEHKITLRRFQFQTTNFYTILI